jgi:hypothetical protein
MPDKARFLCVFTFCISRGGRGTISLATTSTTFLNVFCPLHVYRWRLVFQHEDFQRYLSKFCLLCVRPRTRELWHHSKNGAKGNEYSCQYATDAMSVLHETRDAVDRSHILTIAARLFSVIMDKVPIVEITVECDDVGFLCAAQM